MDFWNTGTSSPRRQQVVGGIDSFLDRRSALNLLQARLAKSTGGKTEKYLATVKEYILREYDAFIFSISNSFGPGTVPLVIAKRDDEIRSLSCFVKKTIKGNTQEVVEAKSIREFHNHVIALDNNKLYIARLASLPSGKGGGGEGGGGERRLELALVESRASSRKPYSEKATKYLAESDRRLEIAFDMGFIGEFVNQYSACETHLLSDGGGYRLLDAIADLSQRREVPFRTYQPIVAPKGGVVVPINDHQLDALKSLRYNVEGIQGPPGTGKSTVIYHITRSFVPEGSVVLATCVQNKAVDAIASKFALTSEDLPFLVYGNEERLGLVGKEWTVDAQVWRHPEVALMRGALRQQMAERQERIRQLKADYELQHHDDDAEDDGDDDELENDIDDEGVRELTRAIKVLQNEYIALQTATAAAIVINAKAILCTVATASRSLLQDEQLAPVACRINCAILDEAGTCSEANLPLLALLPNLDRIIAIGDHNQLAPFTNINPNFTGGRGGGGRGRGRGRGRGGYNSIAAAVVKTPIGFFKRLADELPDGSIPMLSHQYRMHPNIAKYISSTFYDGRLQTPEAVSLARKAVCHQGMWLIPSASLDEKREGSSSTLNPGEADIVLKALKVVTGGRLDVARLKKTIMIITFYKAQEVFIRDVLTKAGYKEDSDFLRILSVDQAQGSEADVVILSCVRSNSFNSLGFTSNPNRLNVAISRARDRIIVIGNPSTLTTDSNWRRLIDVCEHIKHAHLIRDQADGCSAADEDALLHGMHGLAIKSQASTCF